MLSEAPTASTTSDSSIRSEARVDAKPPEIPTDQGLSLKSPLATALVASTAPMRSPNSSSAGPAPPSTAPRPARMRGLSASWSSFTAAAIDSGAGTAVRSAGAGGRGPGSVCAAISSSGRLRTTGRRSRRARWTTRTQSATTVAGVWIRSAMAPTEVSSAGWSIRKLERGPELSAARTSSGVRLLAASVSPVTVLVRPGPWCTLQAGSSPVIRA